jgi:hypothetical protein
VCGGLRFADPPYNGELLGWMSAALSTEPRFNPIHR